MSLYPHKEPTGEMLCDFTKASMGQEAALGSASGTGGLILLRRKAILTGARSEKKVGRKL